MPKLFLQVCKVEPLWQKSNHNQDVDKKCKISEKGEDAVCVPWSHEQQAWSESTCPHYTHEYDIYEEDIRVPNVHLVQMATKIVTLIIDQSLDRLLYFPVIITHREKLVR